MDLQHEDLNKEGHDNDTCFHNGLLGQSNDDDCCCDDDVGHDETNDNRDLVDTMEDNGLGELTQLHNMMRKQVPLCRFLRPMEKT